MSCVCPWCLGTAARSLSKFSFTHCHVASRVSWLSELRPDRRSELRRAQHRVERELANHRHELRLPRAHEHAEEPPAELGVLRLGELGVHGVPERPVGLLPHHRERRPGEVRVDRVGMDRAVLLVPEEREPALLRLRAHCGIPPREREEADDRGAELSPIRVVPLRRLPAELLIHGVEEVPRVALDRRAERIVVEPIVRLPDHPHRLAARRSGADRWRGDPPRG